MSTSRFAAVCLLFLLPQASACQEAPPQEIRTTSPLPEAIPDSTFARLAASISEPGGYFDTDNLISNETSFLHVMDAMRRLDVSGGAYLGVGPDQNYSYMAHVRPKIAFMVDIRSDNVLQHLLFKTLFAGSDNRIEYLCHLFGRELPDDTSEWADRDIEELVAYLDSAGATEAAAARSRAIVSAGIGGVGMAVSDEDGEKIATFHSAFMADGLDLQFNSHYRSPQSYYPTYRDLMLAKDRSGAYENYLAREEDFQFLKGLSESNRILPIVGDLGGTAAVQRIGEFVESQGLAVSAFYTSNVEYYLFGGAPFEQFAENVKALPRNERSVIIRSYFNRYRSSHPESTPGFGSTQLLQMMDQFVERYDAGAYDRYGELMMDFVATR